MSMTSNSVVFKIVLPIIVGLAIFATLDSIKVNSLDNQTDNLGDALSQFNRQITLGGDGEQKARDKYREAAVFNILGAQHCGLVGKPEEAEVTRDYADFRQYGLNDLISNLESSSAEEVFGVETDQESQIYFPGDSKPYERLREDDELLTCAGADQLSSSIPGVSAITEGEGNDMEGRYGRINFEAEETITLKNPDVASFSFPDINHEGTYPNMLAGMKRTAMVPAGCDSEGRYDGRMKMENVPAIMEGDLIGQYDLCDFNEFNQMLEDHENPIQYKICEGATGYIQSNVGDSYNTGEATTQVSGYSFIAGIIEIYGGITGGVGTQGLFQENFMNLEVYPMTIIQQGATECLDEDLLAGDTDSLGPQVDYNDDGDRESCSFSDVESAGQPSSWNGVDIECGLIEEKDSLHYTGWRIPDQQCLSSQTVIEGGEQLNYYDMGSAYRQTEGVTSTEFQNDDSIDNPNIYYDGSLKFQPTDKSNTAEVIFNLRQFSQVNEVNIAGLVNHETDITYSLRMLDGSVNVIESKFDGSLDGYDALAGPKGDTTKIDDVDLSIMQNYRNSFDLHEDKLKFGTTGTVSENMGKEPVSLTIRFETEGIGNSEYANIDNVEILGELRGCN